MQQRVTGPCRVAQDLMHHSANPSGVVLSNGVLADKTGHNVGSHCSVDDIDGNGFGVVVAVVLLGQEIGIRHDLVIACDNAVLDSLVWINQPPNLTSVEFDSGEH